MRKEKQEQEPRKEPGRGLLQLQRLGQLFHGLGLLKERGRLALLQRLLQRLQKLELL